MKYLKRLWPIVIGIGLISVLQTLIQSIMGKDKYLAWIEQGWIDWDGGWYTILYILALLIMLYAAKNYIMENEDG